MQAIVSDGSVTVASHEATDTRGPCIELRWSHRRQRPNDRANGHLMRGWIMRGWTCCGTRPIDVCASALQRWSDARLVGHPPPLLQDPVTVQSPFGTHTLPVLTLENKDVPALRAADSVWFGQHRSALLDQLRAMEDGGGPAAAPPAPHGSHGGGSGWC
jgi:hypothetical protein